MKDSKLLGGISLDIETFKAHLKRISRDGYKLHQLDKDLLLEKTRELYDNILRLETSGQKESVELQKPETVATEPKEDVIETVEEKTVEVELSVPLPEKKEEETKPKETISFEPKKTIIEENEDVFVETPQPEPEPQPEPQTQPQPQSHFDLFSSNQTIVSDKFAGKEEKSIAEKMQQGKIEDLRQAIGINEKFLFINELFNGDMGRYNKTLDELNAMPNKLAIETFLMELKIEKQWDEELDAFVKFKELMDRKF